MPRQRNLKRQADPETDGSPPENRDSEDESEDGGTGDENESENENGETGDESDSDSYVDAPGWNFSSPSNYYDTLTWLDRCAICERLYGDEKCTTLCANDVFSRVLRREGTKRNNGLSPCRKKGDECHYLHVDDVLNRWMEFHYHNDEEYDDGNVHRPTRITYGKVRSFYGEISDYESYDNPYHYRVGMSDSSGFDWCNSSDEELEEEYVRENKGLTGIPGFVIHTACEEYGPCGEGCDDGDVVWKGEYVVTFENPRVLERWVLRK